MSSYLGRRSFIGLAAVAVTGLLCRARTWAQAAKDSNGLVTAGSRLAARLRTALQVRLTAAQGLRSPPPTHATNGDHALYPNYIASFTKSLPHDALGEVDPNAYRLLVSALEAEGAPDPLATVPLAGVVRLANPRAALAFGLEGADGCQFEMPAPPPFGSARLAAEATELYWQALTRDVPFAELDTHPICIQASDDLSRMTDFAGPKQGGRVTPQTLFRGATPGDLAGPYVSQFLWKDVPYGAIRLVQQVRTATPGLDYLTTYDDWLAIQNGAAPPSSHGSAYRYIRSQRDLAAFVHIDFTYQAFLSACLILFGMQGTTDAAIAYKGAPYDPGNPYRSSRTESGFVTLGAAHALDLVARVADAALKACWFQKWIVHRFLRPEEFGGRIHNHRTGRRPYPIHDDVLSSPVLEQVRGKTGTFLLPQAYPEGAPTHPSYPAGHATIAGACATVLKAFFDESFPVDEPVVASADGLKLHPYKGTPLTVGGELNKLASNVAFARNASGIHWRCDGHEGLKLGEAVALSVLGALKHCWNEPFEGFILTRFDGTTAKV